MVIHSNPLVYVTLMYSPNQMMNPSVILKRCGVGYSYRCTWIIYLRYMLNGNTVVSYYTSHPYVSTPPSGLSLSLTPSRSLTSGCKNKWHINDRLQCTATCTTRVPTSSPSLPSSSASSFFLWTCNTWQPWWRPPSFGVQRVRSWCNWLFFCMTNDKDERQKKKATLLSSSSTLFEKSTWSLNLFRLNQTHVAKHDIQNKVHCFDFWYFETHTVQITGKSWKNGQSIFTNHTLIFFDS